MKLTNISICCLCIALFSSTYAKNEKLKNLPRYKVCTQEYMKANKVSYNECFCDVPIEKIAKDENYIIFGNRAIARIKNNKISALTGAIAIKSVNTLYSAENGKSVNIGHISKVDDYSSSCYIEVKAKKNKLSGFYSTSKETRIRTAPSNLELEIFKTHHGKCVDKTVAPGDVKKCVNKKLLGVSDLDSNGRLEFWFDDGHGYHSPTIQIAELTEKSNKMLARFTYYDF